MGENKLRGLNKTSGLCHIPRAQPVIHLTFSIKPMKSTAYKLEGSETWGLKISLSDHFQLSRDIRMETKRAIDRRYASFTATYVCVPQTLPLGLNKSPESYTGKLYAGPRSGNITMAVLATNPHDALMSNTPGACLCTSV